MNVGLTPHDDSDFRPEGSCDAAQFTRTKELHARVDRAEDAYRLGVECRSQNRLDEAIEHYARAIALRPDHAQACNNLGVIQQERGELAAAVRSFQKAIEANPQFGLAWFNRGNCFREENRLDRAISDYRRALQLMPADAQTRINLATVLREMRQFDESLALLDAIPPTSRELPMADFNRALVYFLSGEWGPAWDAYEARLAMGSHAKAIADCRWNGTPLRGRSILLLAEQGIGDQVMFASCLPDLLHQGANCFVECDARLIPLFARSFPQITLFAKSPETEPLARVGPCEVVEFLGTLPRFLRRRIEDFPQSRQVLLPDAERVATWRSSFARRGGAFKVGISWQGGRDAETRRRRSIPLPLWEPIFQVPGVRFVNLQYGPAAAEAIEAGRRLGVVLDDGTDCDPLANLEDFAAKMAALDLIICVDNSTAHLAAAIGRPVWTLLPFAPDWRWTLDGETTPWYPKMRLLRCPGLDHWNEILHRTARRLAAAVFSGGLQSGAA